MKAQGILSEVFLKIASIQALPQSALRRGSRPFQCIRLSGQVLILQDIQTLHSRHYQCLLLLQLLPCTAGNNSYFSAMML